jgi:transposase-like protein
MRLLAGPAWLRLTDEALLALCEEGLSPRFLARQLGISHVALYRRLARACRLRGDGAADR